MSPPVTGFRRKVGGAVMSAVRRLAVRVNHLDHRAVLIKSVNLSIEYKYQIFNIHLILIYLFLVGSVLTKMLAFYSRINDKTVNAGPPSKADSDFACFALHTRLESRLDAIKKKRKEI